jgi:hypothetical protein
MKNSSFVTIFIQNNNWLVLYKKVCVLGYINLCNFSYKTDGLIVITL